MTALVREKDFPGNYSTPLLRVLDAASLTGLTGLRVVGSFAIRSQQYAGDVDAVETVRAPSVKSIARKLTEAVKQLRALPGVFFGDIKIGEIPEWEIVPPRPEDFNRTASAARVDALRADGILTESEAKEAHRLVETATTLLGYLTARKTLRHHILRWTPADILEGVVSPRGDQIVSLEDALASGGVVKIDLIVFVDDRFVEVSVLYTLFVGSKRLTADLPPLAPALREDIAFYSTTDPFKALKRSFSLAKHLKDTRALEVLTPLLNSDLGRLYQIVGDLTTLLTVLGRAPMSRIRDVLDEFRVRFGFLTSVDFDNSETLGTLLSLLAQPSKERLRPQLTKLRDTLQRKLNRATTKEVKALGKHLPK